MELKKRTIASAIGAALATSLYLAGSAAFAQQAPDQQQSQAQQQPAGQSDQRVAYRASDLMDKEVRNQQGQQLASVSDLVLDRDGKVSYVILSYGGFLGMGDNLTAVPWDQLQVSSISDNAITVGISQDRLVNAPSFERDQLTIEDPQWVAEVDQYYQAGGQAAQLASFETLDQNQDGQISRDEAQQSEPLSNQFSEADGNQDGVIDRTEFSAFEEQLSQPQGGQQMQDQQMQDQQMQEQQPPQSQ